LFRARPIGEQMRVEQHLVGLKKIGPDEESAALTQFGVRHLQFGS
jgi:hypothetical protein